jgi:hypothetical protein
MIGTLLTLAGHLVRYRVTVTMHAGSRQRISSGPAFTGRGADRQVARFAAEGWSVEIVPVGRWHR